jgi:hypothetical protein
VIELVLAMLIGGWGYWVAVESVHDSDAHCSEEEVQLLDIEPEQE